MAERIIEGRIYPIGIQSFPELREGGYTYVDKTFFVAKLIKVIPLPKAERDWVLQSIR